MALDERLALNVDEFSQRTIEGSAGFHYARNDYQLRIATQVQRFFVDGEPNRDLFGGTVQWQYDVTAKTQVTLFGQAAALRFPGQTVRDVDRYTIRQYAA